MARNTADKIVVRVSIIDELGCCITGTEFRVTLEAYSTVKKYLETKVTKAIDKMLKGE